MSLAPLAEAGWVIILHVMAALLTLALGLHQFLAAKGTPQHRLIGRAATALLALVALSSFLIHELRTVGPFSPIHILSAFTLYSLIIAITAIRRGDVRRHRNAMIGVFIGFTAAAAFTLLPGRIIYRVVIAG